jgi:predicted molibdopterin-dependent oxidoreductase YjgC
VPIEGRDLRSQRGRFVRVVRLRTPTVQFTFDCTRVEAQEGESLLAALLKRSGHVRRLEFNGEGRAGFCLMGACQDCWVWLGGGRARACTTLVSDGMAIFTNPPDAFPRDA